MTEEIELTYDSGSVTLEWSLETMTDAPDGRFILLDEDDKPRLILDQEELLQLQRGGE